ncbi:MAG TPA: cyclic nucleotide-binding domain-containing protein [Gaiellaceae bacterium]|nr:cyclic nucleotide-binding domain-containing protein [Gaiellaceae bacterium]
MDRSRLEAFPILSGLGADDLDAIASVASEIEVDAGRVLTAEGDFGHAIFAIEQGMAEVSRDGDVLRALGPGDVFGEVAVLASGRRTADVVSTTPMSLIAIFKRDVWALERRSPEAAERLRALVAERLAAQTS